MTTTTQRADTPSVIHARRVHAAAQRAREALELARAAAWDAGRCSRIECPFEMDAASDVTAAVTELVTLALRVDEEAKPVRIPEPGLYKVVEAGPEWHRRKYVRGPKGWTNVDASGLYLNWSLWGALENPVLVRDGIEDGAR